MAITAPVVSVVIPAHNAEPFIGAAVDSVLGQTFRDLELIVVDDGSTDGTAARLQAYADARLSCVRQDNQGVSRARNRGMAESRGRFVAFLDADDVWQPAKLDRQLQALDRRQQCRACYTTAVLTDARLQPFGEQRTVEGSVTLRNLLIYGNLVPAGASSVLCTRGALDEAGAFDASLSLCADWDLWLRMAERTCFACVDEPLVLYRCLTHSMSRNVHVLERDTMAVLNKAVRGLPEPRLRRRVYGHHYRVLSGSYWRGHALRDSLRCLSLALRHDPRQLLYALALPARVMGRRGAATSFAADLRYFRDLR